MTVLSWLFAVWVGFWLVIAATVEPQSMVEIVFDLAWLAVAVPLFASLLWSARRPALRRRRVTQALAMLAAVLALEPVTEVALWLKVQIHFRRQRPSYDAIVERLQHEPLQTVHQEYDGVRFELENDPLRVAFPTDASLSDLWCAVVFDPTEELMTINSLDQARWHGNPLVSLFGGDIKSCRKLDSPYLFCCFSS